MMKRQTPPGRTSISCVVVVKPFGPHQRSICCCSVHARNTTARGASNVRVVTISRSEVADPGLFPLTIDFSLSAAGVVVPARTGEEGGRAPRLRTPLRHRGEQLRHAVHAVGGAAFHAGGDHSVAVLDGLEDGSVRDLRLAVLLLEDDGFEQHVTWEAF